MVMFHTLPIRGNGCARLISCCRSRNVIASRYVGRCAADSEEARLAPAISAQSDIKPILVQHPVPAKSGLAFYLRLLANLFSSRPYSVTSHHSVANMRDAIDEYEPNEKSVDVWQFEWALPFRRRFAVPGSRVVIAHNVDTLIWQRYYENETNLLKQAFLKTQWKKFRSFEDQAFRQATRVVAVSEDDAAHSRTLRSAERRCRGQRHRSCLFRKRERPTRSQRHSLPGGTRLAAKPRCGRPVAR